MTDYDALKFYGFSPLKSQEIMIDSQRGKTYALGVVSLARRKCSMVIEAYSRGYSPSRIAREEGLEDQNIVTLVDMFKLSMNYLGIALSMTMQS